MKCQKMSGLLGEIRSNFKISFSDFFDFLIFSKY